MAKVRDCGLELRKSRVFDVFYTGGDFALNIAGNSFYNFSNVVKVLNVNDGSERYFIGDKDQEARVTSFVLKEDDSEIVVAYTSDVLKRYSLDQDTPKLLHQFRATHNGSSDFSTKIWDMKRQYCTHNSAENSLSQRCALLILVEIARRIRRRMLRMFNLGVDGEQKKVSVEWTHHTGRITSIFPHPNNSANTVVVFSRDEKGSILNTKIWSFVTASVVREAKVSRTQLDSVVYCPSTGVAVCATIEGDLVFMDVAFSEYQNSSLQCCHLIHGHSESILSVDSPSWDDYMLATASKDNSVMLWKLANSHPFIITVSNDTTLKFWPLGGLKSNDLEIQKLTASSTFVAHSKDINSVDISSNDKLCLTASIKLWHIDKKTMEFGIAGTLEGHKRGVWSAQFSKNLQSAATCSGDCTIKVFSLIDNLVCTLCQDTHLPFCLSYSSTRAAS
uniref:Uncharacterized protein n=1 Tax=Ditylenchus dipsaci TaxID=166011 RepID=A0A915DEZ8_9BILA